MMDLKMEVYTPSLELVGILEVHRSVIWEEKAFGAGSFSVDSLITAESKTLLVPGNIVWISEDYAGVIEYVQEQSGKEGPYITVKGPDLTGILGQRILWGQYNLTGTAPAIMHSLVNDSCISPTRGDTEARKIPGLVSLDVPTGGDAIRVQKTGGTLLKALEELGAAFGVAFGVRFNPAIPRMEFWTRWGQNRGINQDVNDPVFYSTELDDVLSSEYSYNAQDYRNVALVAGEGDGGDRVMVTVNADVTPAPIPPTPGTKYTITLSVDPEGGGVATGGGQINEGESVTVIATPSSGYTFSAWQENGQTVSTSVSYTFTANANRNLTAVFAAVIPTYTITATIDPDGSGTVTGAGQYQQGATVTLTATVNDGYTFTDWKENGETVSTDNPYTFTATGNRAFTAAFAEKPSSRLPAGYTEVEYIENPNGTYIRNIGYYSQIYPLNSQRFEFKIKLKSIPTEAKSIYGSRYISRTGTQYYAYLEVNYSKNFSISGVGGSIQATLDISNIIIDLPKKLFSVNGVENTLSTDSKAVSNGAPVDLFGHGLKDDKTGGSLSNYKNFDFICYSFKVYESTSESTGELKHDFVPCIDSDSNVGLYDIVEGQFYGSAVSNLDFTPGPAV